MPKTATTMIPTAGKPLEFTQEDMVSAANIATKLAYLTKENLIFIDGVITGAIMAQTNFSGEPTAQ